jgi:tetratricopeptide (TPR) repeat protein
MPSIEKLESLLTKDPDDVFLNFGLAMALRSAGRSEAALERFERTLRLDPGYVPAYFQKARLLAEVGETEAARVALGRGIEQARASGDTHAAGEMDAILAALGD